MKAMVFYSLLLISSILTVQAQKTEILKDTKVLGKNKQQVSMLSQLKPGKLQVLVLANESCTGCMEQVEELGSFASGLEPTGNMWISVVYTGKLKNMKQYDDFGESETPHMSVYVDTPGVYKEWSGLSTSPVLLFANDQGRLLYAYSDQKPVPAKKIREVAEGLFSGRIKPNQLSFDAEWLPCNRDTATYYREFSWDAASAHYNLTDFYKNGKPQMKGRYTRLYPMVSDGEFSFYLGNGLLESKRLYANDQPAGQWIYYDSSGKAVIWEQYRNGVLDGPYKKIYDDESYLEGQMKDGFRTGVWKAYHTNKRLAMEAGWKDGKMNGMFKRWDEQGVLFLQINMRDNKFFFDTTPILLYDNGQPIVEVYNIAADHTTANMKYYTKEGALILQRTPLDKDRFRVLFYGAKGEQQAQYDIDTKNKCFVGTSYVWFEDGKKKYELVYKGNTVVEGSKAWHTNGKLSEYYDPADKKIKCYDENGYPTTNYHPRLNGFVGNPKSIAERYQKIFESADQMYTLVSELVL